MDFEIFKKHIERIQQTEEKEEIYQNASKII